MNFRNLLQPSFYAWSVLFYLFTFRSQFKVVCFLAAPKIIYKAIFLILLDFNFWLCIPEKWATKPQLALTDISLLYQWRCFTIGTFPGNVVIVLYIFENFMSKWFKDSCFWFHWDAYNVLSRYGAYFPFWFFPVIVIGSNMNFHQIPLSALSGRPIYFRF